MIKAGIVGATGYTGSELLRILIGHPEVSLNVVTSHTEKNRPVSEIFPHLRGHIDQVFCDHDTAVLRECDVVFFATPNGTAMHQVGSLLDDGIKIIDLSADFRLKDVDTWSTWYGQPHAAKELLDIAVYGLPELHRKEIASAQLVANPGCYPTAVILALVPLLKSGCIDPESVIADAKSGVSGAGRKASLNLLFGENGESFRAYGAGGHRHSPEITQELNTISKSPVRLTFVPHLVPMIRGIHATVYAKLIKAIDLQGEFESCYHDEKFVDVLPPGSHPETRTVRGSNVCRLAVHNPGDGDQVIILSVIDNLVKGAAGQAIQNLNIMFGLNETSGLDFPSLVP